MAVAFDASSARGTTGSTGDLSWTHTPVGTPKGAVVYICQTTATATDPVDQVVGVTYGGVSMTRVETVAGNNGVTESVRSYAYFLGSGLLGTAATVAVDVNASETYEAYCFTVTADTDTEVVDFVSIFENQVTTFNAGTLALSSRTSFVSLGLASTENATSDLTPTTGWTSSHEGDHGSQTSAAYRYNTVAGSDVAATLTVANGWGAIIGVAISEVAGGGGISIPIAAFHYMHHLGSMSN